MKVMLKNEKTGELKGVKVGWSWVLFFWSGFLGIPLFLRRLNMLGIMFLAFWFLNFMVNFILVSSQALIIQSLLFLIIFGLTIWMGVKGNELTAKNYLENGWVFLNTDSEETKHAKVKWKLA